MRIALPHRHYDNAHLAAVKTEMATMGTPTIKAFWSELYGMYLAIEGSHRIRAAFALGLEPIIDVIDPCGIIIVEVDGDDENVDAAEHFEMLQGSANMTEIIDFD